MEDNVPEPASLTENQKNLEKNDNPPEPDVNNPADEGVITVIISYESTELERKKNVFISTLEYGGEIFDNFEIGGRFN